MQIDIIGVPMDHGSGRRGVDMGPSAVRYAGLEVGLEALGHTVSDLGNVEVPPSETLVSGDPRLKYLDHITGVLQRLSDRVADCVEQGHVGLVLGGDHSLALGSVAGAAQNRRIGLIWLDTHGDFNTHETTPSGNIHGMPLAALCGYGDERLVTLGGKLAPGPKVDPHNIAIVGVRDLDDEERVLMRRAGVHVFSMESIDRLGISEVMDRAVSVASAGTDGIYVSLDLDVVDPMHAPGVGTPYPGGMTYREAHLAMEILAECDNMIGMDVVEVNPILDKINMTAELAVKLILSAFGKRVWERA
jgi:arginase